MTADSGLNIKVLNSGIIFLSILRKLNHCSLLRTKYKNLCYSLGFNDQSVFVLIDYISSMNVCLIGLFTLIY